MQSDEDMMAQIANIEAQLSMQGQGGGASSAAPGGWQTSTFGGSTFGGPAQAAQGFPRQPMGQPATAAAAATQAHGGHQFSKDTDDRSVFVGNLPKGVNGITTTPEELSQFFADCGPMLTVTVIRDKTTGELKGTAYVEFATHEAAGRAIDTKNNANFKGSTIIVTKKRSLFRPGMGRGGSAPGVAPHRGRGGRGGPQFQPDPMQAMMALMAMSAASMQQAMLAGGGRGGARGSGHRGGRGGGHRGGHDGGFQPFQ